MKSERTKKVCLHCQKEFEVIKSREHKAKYCSRECRDKGQSKKVKTKCSWCGKELTLSPSTLEEHNFCDLKCLGKWNGERNKKRIVKNCEICGKDFEIVESREHNAVACSIECQNKWQSIHRRGENSPTWKGGGGTIKCATCGKEFYVGKYNFEHDLAKFCSVECKREYWTKYIRTTKDFDNKQRKGNAKQWSNPEFRKKISQTALKTLASYPRETSIEKKIREWLNSNNIHHNCQHIINDKFCVDFYLPDENIIIEAVGDYWHSNPIKYPNDSELNAMQVRNKKMDKARIAYLTKCGYSLFVLWERDINEDLDKLMNPIRDICTKSLETDISTSEKMNIQSELAQ